MSASYTMVKTLPRYIVVAFLTIIVSNASYLTTTMIENNPSLLNQTGQEYYTRKTSGLILVSAITSRLTFRPMDYWANQHSRLSVSTTYLEELDKYDGRRFNTERNQVLAPRPRPNNYREILCAENDTCGLPKQHRSRDPMNSSMIISDFLRSQQCIPFPEETYTYNRQILSSNPSWIHDTARILSTAKS
jgi:hypothetical protein